MSTPQTTFEAVLEIVELAFLGVGLALWADELAENHWTLEIHSGVGAGVGRQTLVWRWGQLKADSCVSFQPMSTASLDRRSDSPTRRHVSAGLASETCATKPSNIQPHHHPHHHSRVVTASPLALAFTSNLFAHSQFAQVIPALVAPSLTTAMSSI